MSDTPAAASAVGLPGHARHVKGCHITQETTMSDALGLVAGLGPDADVPRHVKKNNLSQERRV